MHHDGAYLQAIQDDTLWLLRNSLMRNSWHLEYTRFLRKNAPFKTRLCDAICTESCANDGSPLKTSGKPYAWQSVSQKSLQPANQLVDKTRHWSCTWTKRSWAHTLACCKAQAVVAASILGHMKLLQQHRNIQNYLCSVLLPATAKYLRELPREHSI